MINKAGIDLIKRFEGCILETYADATGTLTIGYGTTAAAEVGLIPRWGLRITEREAESYLMVTLSKFEDKIRFGRAPNENQKAAMLSLAYNIGPGAFQKSTVLRNFNAGKFQEAADAFRMWNKAGGKVLPGLVERREAERALFLTPAKAQKVAAVPKNDLGWLALEWIKALFGGRK